jgi:hypothetical protein
LQQETTNRVWCRTCIFCIILSFLGLSFHHIPNNLSNYNVLTANAPYQISGTWYNHDNATSSKMNQATDLQGWKKHHNLLDTNIKSSDDDTTLIRPV